MADEPQRLYFEDDGRTPNNRLPVLVYAGGLHDAEAIETRFAANDWPPQWRGGVFDYHHYHSVAHEALGVAAGRAQLILGDEQGRRVTIAAGDVLLLPAGTGHRRLSASEDFLLVGAYPPDQQDWDVCRPGVDPIAPARRRIEALSLPAGDPVHGADGPLVEAWRARR